MLHHSGSMLARGSVKQLMYIGDHGGTRQRSGLGDHGGSPLRRGGEMAANQRRKPIHLPAYDYRTPGPYFVTICTNGRVPLFGRIDDGEFQPNPAGAMVAGAWGDIPT